MTDPINLHLALTACFCSIKQILSYNTDDIVSNATSEKFDSDTRKAISYIRDKTSSIEYISRETVVFLLRKYYREEHNSEGENFAKVFDCMFTKLSVDTFYWGCVELSSEAQ
jgi:hypothetical protein